MNTTIRQAFCHGLWSPTKSDFLFALGCISLNEQEVALRFAYQRDVLSSMAGKLLVRGTAVRNLGICPYDVKLDRTLEGRPFLLNHCDMLDFNISHGGDFTIIAATSKGRCGADVMRVELPPFQKSVNDFVLKMKNVFSPVELDRILSPVSETDRIKRFYEHWCLKEAYVKALGCGLRIPLRTIECKSSDDDKATENWVFEKHALPHNHLAIIAWFGDSNMGTETDVPITQLTYDQLIDKLTVIYPVKNAVWDQFLNKPRAPPSSRQQIPYD
ncbi:unnamed protein product [Heterobilharzia americana]|nr:unnamed protein product [Heterobilharzia americana]